MGTPLKCTVTDRKYGYTLAMLILTTTLEKHWIPIRLTGKLDRTAGANLHNGNSVEIVLPGPEGRGLSMWVKAKDIFADEPGWDPTYQATIDVPGLEPVKVGPYRPLTEAEIIALAKQAPDWVE